MIYIITPENRHLFQTTLTKMHVLRHELFIQGRGWKLPSRNNEEHDQFDHEDAVYIVNIEPGGGVTGTARLIPSTSSHMLNDVFSDLCADGVPVGSEYWEVTRGGVTKGPGATLVWVSIAVACFEYCRMLGGEYLTLVTDLHFFQDWVASGAEISPLGEPVEHEDGTFIAAKVKMTNQWLAKTRSLTNLPSPVFSYVREEFKAA